jgi:hypothetical protein
MRLALAGVPLIVVALWSGPAWTQYQDQAIQGLVVQLNKQALADVSAREWDGAKRKLLEALVEAKKGGLENHPLMARTYVHLGVVYITGLKNRDKGLQSFARAFAIQPDIRLSRSVAITTEVEEAFAEAGGRPVQVPRPAVTADDFTEPDLPVRVNALDCPVAEHTRVDEAVPVRCALAPSLPVTNVFLIYRNPVNQRFTEVEMKRTPKGWFQGRITEEVIYGKSVHFYFEGRNAAGKPIVRNGEAQSPNFIIVHKR